MKSQRPFDPASHAVPVTDDAAATPTAGYAKPPVEHRFRPGKSGNPRGRPKSATGIKATTKRVLLEKHVANPDGRGKKKYTALELVIWMLKQQAADGDRRATKALRDFDEQYAPPPPERRVGFLLLPERLTEEEWEARYMPKDDPPADDGGEWT